MSRAIHDIEIRSPAVTGPGSRRVVTLAGDQREFVITTSGTTLTTARETARERLGKDRELPRARRYGRCLRQHLMPSSIGTFWEFEALSTTQGRMVLVTAMFAIPGISVER
jgi:hypothetical protein